VPFYGTVEKEDRGIRLSWIDQQIYGEAILPNRRDTGTYRLRSEKILGGREFTNLMEIFIDHTSAQRWPPRLGNIIGSL
jgi:hypothetical protein